MLDPTRVELLGGVLCTLCLLANLYYKWHNMTLIFMLNPCHFVVFVQVIVFFSKFSVKAELLTLFIVSSAFGGWCGMIWSENIEMTFPELVVYYLEHAFASFLGPLVLSLGGRFDPLDYVAWPLPISGYHLFAVYMRYVLTPLSQLTWANLNHSLCGVGNDPFYEHFNLGYTYFFWADFYLLFGLVSATVTNFVICWVFKKLFGRFFESNRVNVQENTPNKMD